MDTKSLLYGLSGLILGGLIVSVAATYGPSAHPVGDSMTMDDMTGTLNGKTGDDFDKAFLAAMIVHHQGAIDMANLAKQQAKHPEIKAMAEDITSAQSQEIDLMQSWQSDWNYRSVPESHGSQTHGMMDTH